MLKLHWSVHSIKTSNKHHLNRPNAKFSCFQKSAFYAGVRIFNSLQRGLSLKNEEAQFIVALRSYLNKHSLYPVYELSTSRGNL